MSRSFHGVFTALVTPFKKINSNEHEIDFESFDRLLDLQMSGKIHGVVVNGTTAESPCLNKEEVYALFTKAKSKLKAHQKVILGTGSNCTQSTIANTKMAKEWGADAALVVVPYYNKPSQEGIYQHFKAVANSCDIPILLYNVPSRTVSSMNAETLSRLSEIPNIMGIKEASGNLELLKEMKAKARKDFVFLSGDDASFLDFIFEGGHGVISVLSNPLPAECMRWWQSAMEGKKSVLETFKVHLHFTNLLFKESNPSPVKYVLHKMGIIQHNELRLPLWPIQKNLETELDVEMKKLKIISE